MSNITFPVKLSDLVKDYEKSFWKGNGKVSFTEDDLVEILEKDPKITVGAVRELRKQNDEPGWIHVGLDFNAEHDRKFTLGEPVGGTGGTSVGFNLKAGADAGLDIILSKEDLHEADDELSDNLEQILNKYSDLDENEALMVLSFDGTAQAGLLGSAMYNPAVKASFNLNASGGYECAYCLEVKDDEELWDAIRRTFRSARLPQTSPELVTESGLPREIWDDEILSTRYTGFLKLGAEVPFGYKFNGTKGEKLSLGKLDLLTKLEVQANAYLKADYQLAGDFQVLIVPCEQPGWVRVVVEKDRSSEFDFAFGLTVDAKLNTEGTKPGIEMVESILGTTTSQTMKKALKYARMTPEDLREKVDGFTAAVIEEWIDTEFRNNEDSLQKVLDRLNNLRTAVEEVDDRLVAIYEQFMDDLEFDKWTGKVQAILSFEGSLVEKKQKLINEVSTNPRIRKFLESLVNENFGSIITKLDDEASDLQAKLQGELNKFDRLMNEDVKEDIRGFVEARKKALKLDRLFAELAGYDTIEELQDKATTAVKELVGNLLDEPLDKLIGHPEIKELFDKTRSLANRFEEILTEVGNKLHQALNASGRIDIARTYSRDRKRHRLVDVQIHVGAGGDAGERAVALYHDATRSDFRQVLREEDPNLVRINSATFSDSLRKGKTLKVHLFGWDFRSTSSILSQLDGSIQVGPSGKITVYKLRVEGERLVESRKRAAELNYMLQVDGTAQGVFEDSQELRQRAIVAAEEMKDLQNSFSYHIRDELTSLDELRCYFSLAKQLGLIEQADVDKLVRAVIKLRGSGLKDDDFGRVAVRYTVSFDGEALAAALGTNFGSKMELTGADANQRALQKMFVDRLKASYYVSRDPNPKHYGILALYANGVHDELSSNPNTGGNSMRGMRITLKQNENTVTVVPNQMNIINARRLYLRNAALSEFLERFRVAVAAEETIQFGKFERLLKKLMKKLKKPMAGERQLDNLPLMVLDEMVRQSVSGEDAARSALLEITLFDPTGENEVGYIPITA